MQEHYVDGVLDRSAAPMIPESLTGRSNLEAWRELIMEIVPATVIQGIHGG